MPPALLACDEPVSALDVSLAAQVLNLLCDLRASLGIALLFVTHDLAAARAVAEEVAVMSEGVIVEHGPTEQIFSSPEHPYTRELLAAVLRRGNGAAFQRQAYQRSGDLADVVARAVAITEG